MKKKVLLFILCIGIYTDIFSQQIFPSGTTVTISRANPGAIVCANSDIGFNISCTKNFTEIAGNYYFVVKGWTIPSGYSPGFVKGGVMKAITVPYATHSNFGLVTIDWSPIYKIYINNVYSGSTSSNFYSFVPQGDFTIRAELDMRFSWRPVDDANFCNITEQSSSAGQARNNCIQNASNYNSLFYTSLASNSEIVNGVIQGPSIENISAPASINTNEIYSIDAVTNAQRLTWSTTPNNYIVQNSTNARTAKIKAPATSQNINVKVEAINFNCPNAISTSNLNISVINQPPTTPIISDNIYRISKYGVKIKWNPSNDGLGVLQGYRVERTNNVTLSNNIPTLATYNASSFYANLSSNINEITINATGESWYAARVFAYDNENSLSAPSVNVFYQVDDVAPAIPNSLAFVNSNNGLYKLTWQGVSDFSGIKKYEIWYNDQKWRVTDQTSYTFGKGELGDAL